MPSNLSPPPPGGLWRELSGALELPRLLLRAPELARAPRGRGAPLLVLPGFGASDGSTAPLRGYLRWLGHRPLGWGLGVNRGDVPALIPRVIGRAEALAELRGGPVPLVGWSLGGVLAREAARERPDLVSRVVTLGSPVVGGPKYTTVAGFYRRRGIDLDAIEAEVAARNARPIEVPVLAIYSRRDGVVSWQACIDEHSPDVEHVEVTASHIGLGFSAEVWVRVAGALAVPGGDRAGAGHY